MRRTIPLVLVLMAVSGCAEAEASSTRRRLEVRVDSCLPVGYGSDCSCEVRSPETNVREAARLEACVGRGDTIRLSERLASAPLVGSSGSPLSLSMDVEPAAGSELHCGILRLASGERLRVVALEP